MLILRKIIYLFFLGISLNLLQIYAFSTTFQNIIFISTEDQNFDQAEILRKSGDFEKAVLLLDKSLELARDKRDSERECRILMTLGILYWNLGNLPESTEKFESAYNLAKRFNFSKEVTECRLALDVYFHYQKAKRQRDILNLYKSIEEFRKAIEISKQIGSREHELKCTRQLGFTFWNMKNFQQSYAYTIKALEIAEDLNHEREIGNCSNNIGLYYWQMTEFSKALSYYQKALDIARNLSNTQEESNILNNMGVIFKSIGNFEKSVEYLKASLKIDEQFEDKIQIAKTLNNIGITYRLRYLQEMSNIDFDQSLLNFKDSLILAKKYGDKETEIKILNNLGSLFSDAKQYNEALHYFKEASLQAEQNNDSEAIGMILNNIGIVYYNQGNYAESTEYFQKAIDVASKISGGQILWEAYLELANAYKEQKKIQLAIRNYQASIRNIENIRSNIDLEEYKASYLGTDKRITAYENLIDLLLSLHQHNPKAGFEIEAFKYMEQARARAFLDRLEISKLDISHHIDFKLLNREKELEKNITNIYNKLIRAESTSGDRSTLEEQLQNYEDELEALRREIRAKYSAYAELNFPQAISVKQAQSNLLDNKTAFYAYSIGTETSHAFVLTKKDFQIFQIPSQKILEEMISAYLKVITDRDNQNFHLGYDLFNKLVRPGLKAGIENIIFIPGDVLNFLPFETLIAGEKPRRWLIEDFRISYAPSISSLNELIKRKKLNGSKRHRDLLAFGDPYFGALETEGNGHDILQNVFSTSAYSLYRLEFSNNEIDKISSLFKTGKRTIFKRSEASEEQLKNQLLDDYKIIHFATHSLVDNKKPARSSIVLSLDNDQREDGFLQMREIYNLKLNTDLVTLSACQTGLGQYIKGEGIEGINRAFFYAGSSSVLMSLWAVNDQATSQLMERFYAHLRSSQSITNALRRAKLELIKSKVLYHPYYWAAFIVSGKADQIIFPKKNQKYIFIGAALLLIGTALFSMKIRKKRIFH